MCLKSKTLDEKTKEKLPKQIIQQCNDLEKILQGTKEEYNFYKYEFIRQDGHYNMLDSKARKLTGLTEEEYFYIINNYNKLMIKYPKVKKLATAMIQYMKSAKITQFILLNGCKNCIEIVNKKLDVKIEDLCKECKTKILSFANF